MTKFEEEFKALTSWDWVNVDLIQKILAKFGNWHSDEEFQEMKESYWNQAESILSMLEEIKSLKSQLQQQALPVVPEYVAEWYEGCAPIPVETCITDFLFNYQKEKSVDDGTEFEQWFIRTDNSIEILMDMKRLGYQVEKPQLFYLRDELTGQFLAKDNQFKDKDRYFFWTGADPLTHSIGTAWKLTFTQQEIDSMQTGSYEQIPVPVEDGE
ncbi:DUF1642 domain-containing protein [Lactococcus lactis]|uniref:DUF1642 domain-containing protein n=1 Tax=Lactococcus lactis TaxID=1358 RepID=UPI00210B3A2E|nr:DUF1642 domain-containing protein [Lactococcus lactis]MCQ4972360.1 DUF1642 domain-containing protein [Lactococcus lactis]MCQ4998166.1 DUF1642 domain-containing protein [Lactococcus lactis]